MARSSSRARPPRSSTGRRATTPRRSLPLPCTCAPRRWTWSGSSKALGSGPFKASESRASLIFPSPRSYGEKVAEGRMRGIFRQLNHPSPGLASLAPLRPLPADAGRGEKKDRLSPDPITYCLKVRVAHRLLGPEQPAPRDRAIALDQIGAVFLQ